MTGRSLRTLGDVIEAAQLVHDKGAEVVLVSLGAGDVLLAGFLSSGGQGASSLHQALSWGAAATALPESGMPAPHHLNRHPAVIHDRIDLDRILVAGA